jgi:3-oxoadipate enol-lactonase
MGRADAPLIVLGPSLGTSTRLWHETAALLGQSFRLAAWDLPGHGHSPATTEPFSVSEIAVGLLNALDAAGIARFALAGVSLGGAVSLETLLAAPDRVTSAAIICSGAKIGSYDGWIDRAATVRSQGTAALVVPSAGRWFAPGSIERHPDETGRLLNDLRDAHDEAYALCAEALALWDARPRLGGISVPVLAVWGEHDSVAPESNAVAIAAGVQRGTVARVDDAAHLVPVEQPAVAASILTAFFEGES